MSVLDDFKTRHKEFTKALKYMNENAGILGTYPKRWEKIKENFSTKFEEPLDAAWLALDADTQKKMGPLYLYRKAAQDEAVKRVINVFDAKIVGVTPIIEEILG